MAAQTEEHPILDASDQPVVSCGTYNPRALRESIVPTTYTSRPMLEQAVALPLVGGKPLVGRVDTFDGEGPMSLSEWFDILADKQDICGWTDRQVAAIIRDSVRGRARDAIRHLVNDKRGLDKRAIMQSLWNTFRGPAQGFTARAQLHGMVQGEAESLYEFSKKLSTLCAQAFPNRDPGYAEDRALQAFEVGVRNPALRQYLQLQYPETLLAAVQLSEAWTASQTPAVPPEPTYEVTIPSDDEEGLVLTAGAAQRRKPDATPRRRQKSSASVPVNLKLTGSLADAFHRFLEQEKVGGLKPRGTRRGRGNSRQSRNRSPSPRGRGNSPARRAISYDTCARCGKTGHWAKDCKVKVGTSHSIEEASSHHLNE